MSYINYINRLSSDIKKVIDEIKKVAENCGYYYEGVGGPDLINIKNFFENELGLKK